MSGNGSGVVESFSLLIIGLPHRIGRWWLLAAFGAACSGRMRSNPSFVGWKRKCDGNMSVGKWGRARCSENPFHADGDEVVANAFTQQHRERDAKQIGSHEAQGHDDGIADAGNKREKAHERTFPL